jgi:hypothetical protein
MRTQIHATSYAVPPAVLNVALHEHDTMPCQDDIYRIPDDWLGANTRRFYFTTQQIIEAAKPQFSGDSCSVERWSDYPAVCGIYFLVANKKIVYVGMSNLIPRRIFRHRDNGMSFDSLAWFEAPTMYIKDIEAYYIWRCNPPMNNKWPNSGHFGDAAKLLDEKHGEKRNDVEHVITIVSPLSLPWA